MNSNMPFGWLECLLISDETENTKNETILHENDTIPAPLNLLVQQYSVSKWKDKEKENTTLFLTLCLFQHILLLYIYGIIQCDVWQEPDEFSRSPLEKWTTKPNYVLAEANVLHSVYLWSLLSCRKILHFLQDKSIDFLTLSHWYYW